MSFSANLIKEVITNLKNDYSDNFDSYRFGQDSKGFKYKIGVLVKQFFGQRNFFRIDIDSACNNIEKIQPYLSRFEAFYNKLENQLSKELLVKILAYRILGHKKVKLPLNTPEYWKSLEDIEKIKDKSDFIKISFQNWKLYRIPLRKWRYPIELYFMPQGVLADYVVKQYEYHSSERHIKVQPGDTVIDAGGCWGDTALYFANEAGLGGKVYTFEFIPGNINIMKKNFSLNPTLEEKISIVEHPLWDTSARDVYYVDNGPGSNVSFDVLPDTTGKTKTKTIDDLVYEEGIAKVNFIKMDIEGAELPALHGAKRTIQKHRPTLAITLYHSLNDFVGIPEFIGSLGLDYKFYLGHYSIHAEETVLFAVAE